MTLFYFLNGWAGQNAIFDATLRFFYVASVPLLATWWLALLFFRREKNELADQKNEGFIGGAARSHAVISSRRAVVVATVLALTFCALSFQLFNRWCESVLQTPILSPRPFVSHWANLLVVEPNDNSFPSPEALLIGVLWIAIWATARRANFAALSFGVAACLTRVVCGTHYFADVAVGFAIGAAFCALSMAACGVVLRVSSRPFRQRIWRLRAQAAVSCGVFLFVIALGVLSLRDTPRLLAKWQTRNANANANATQIAAKTDALHDIEYSKKARENGTHESNTHEGEGGASENAPSSSRENTDAHGKEIPRPNVTTLGGFLPREETRLLRVLKRANLPHSLVSIDVAALRDQAFVMHCASVRFQVRRGGSAERRRVAQTAKRIVQLAFATDSALQNVDVVGVVLNDPQRDRVRYAVFAVGAIPVFTASIQRKDLVSAKFATWLNAPNADAGLWLRARSQLYINERFLPSRDMKNLAATSLFLPTVSETKMPDSAAKKSLRQMPPKAISSTRSVSPDAQNPLSQKLFRPQIPRKAPLKSVFKTLQKSASTELNSNKSQINRAIANTNQTKAKAPRKNLAPLKNNSPNRGAR